MDIFTLKCFLSLVEYHNFTKAAFHLHVSQPTLSRIIAGMESEMDVKLFHRGKYDISLSEAGKEFFVHSKRIVQDYERAVFLTQAVDCGQRGSIRVGFLPALCMNILPKLTKRMREEYSQFELLLEPLTQEKIANELKEGMIDLGIMLDWNINRLTGFKKELFFKDDYYVVLYPDHKLADRNEIYLDDICSENCLFYKREDVFNVRDDAEIGILAAQFETELNVFFEHTKSVSDLLGLFTLIECKIGIGILPLHLKTVNFSNLKFVKLILDKKEFDFVFRGVACYKQESENPVIQIVLKILKEETEKLNRDQ